MDDFLQKLKKVVRTVLYGPPISQSDCRKPVRISCNIINTFTNKEITVCFIELPETCIQICFIVMRELH